MTAPWREIRKNIEGLAKIYSPNVLLMVSGGVDSMFLLDFCSRCDFDFDIVHFNHNIRDGGYDDLKVINKLRAEINLEKLKTGKRQVELHFGRGSGLRDISNQEAEAYKQRWAFVEKVIYQKRYEWDSEQKWDEMHGGRDGEEAFYHRNQCPTFVVITAHHLNDNIESTLMNLMHGKQHKQLALKEERYFQVYTKFKPLLDVPKSEIIDQAQLRRIEWNEDSTNVDNKNERNWLRNVIIPQLMERRNLESSMLDSLKEASSAGFN